MIMVRKVSLKMASSSLGQGPACLLVDFLFHFVLSRTPLGKGNFLFLEQTNPTEFSYNCRIVKMLIAEAEMRSGVLNPEFIFCNLGEFIMHNCWKMWEDA